MAWVILDGLGTIRVGSKLLKPGGNRVDDPDVLAYLREKDWDCVHIQDSLDQPQPAVPEINAEEDAEPEPEAPESPYEGFEGRDGQFYFMRPGGEGEPVVQMGPFDTEEAAAAAIDVAVRADSQVPKANELDTGPEHGTLTPSELQDKEFECPAEDCDKMFPSTGARRNHVRIMHQDLAKTVS